MGIPEDVLEWLLQPDNPPVRYLTLTHLLRKPHKSSEVRKTKARLMDYSPSSVLCRTLPAAAHAAAGPEFMGRAHP